MISAMPFRWTEPSTWPWPFYVWLALILAGWLKPLWRWIERQRASGWPTAIGEIQSEAVTKSKGFFISGAPRRKSPVYVAELGYSYSVAGKSEAGSYKR